MAPEVKDPVVLQEPTRDKIGILGAVRANDGSLFADLLNSFTWEVLGGYLMSVIQLIEPGRKMVIVLDNARYHHARGLQPWLDEVKDRLELLFLPPYSPQLNAIERVWKLLRRWVTHNRYFPLIQALYDALWDQLDRWSYPNEELKSLCVIS